MRWKTYRNPNFLWAKPDVNDLKDLLKICNGIKGFTFNGHFISLSRLEMFLRHILWILMLSLPLYVWLSLSLVGCCVSSSLSTGHKKVKHQQMVWKLENFEISVVPYVWKVNYAQQEVEFLVRNRSSQNFANSWGRHISMTTCHISLYLPSRKYSNYLQYHEAWPQLAIAFSLEFKATIALLLLCSLLEELWLINGLNRFFYPLGTKNVYSYQ